MYATIRKYKADDVDETLKQVRERFVPQLAKGPGFKGYYLMRVSDDTFVSISFFDSSEWAEESNKMAQAWIEKNIPHLVHDPIEFTSGEVMAHIEK